VISNSELTTWNNKWRKQ